MKRNDKNFASKRLKTLSNKNEHNSLPVVDKNVQK